MAKRRLVPALQTRYILLVVILPAASSLLCLLEPEVIIL